MNFNILYKEALLLWPEEIDISDGTQRENGILFKNLSFFWDKAEEQAKQMGEWYDLVTWIIFQNFHHIAKRRFLKGKKSICKNELNMNQVKADLINNLMAQDYSDMFNEFIRNNPDVE